MATGSIIFLLDVACILWIIAVLSDPWAFLLKIIEALFKFIIVVLGVMPILYGVVLKMNGVDDVFGQIMMAYVLEIVALGIFLGGLLSLNGFWSLIKSTAALFQLMISVPAMFVIVSIGYFAW